MAEPSPASNDGTGSIMSQPAVPAMDQAQEPSMVQDIDQDQAPTQDELLAHVRAMPGTALIKAEYIDFTKVAEKFRRRAATNRQMGEKRKDPESASNDGGQAQKKPRMRGQNKRRPRDKRSLAEDRPCLDFLRGAGCRFGEKCRFSHDIKKLTESKLPDIGPKCHFFETYGKCPYGLMCRFGGSHTGNDFQSIVDEEKVRTSGGKPKVLNILSKDLQIQLRKKNYPFKKYYQYMRSSKSKGKGPNQVQDKPQGAEGDRAVAVEQITHKEKKENTEAASSSTLDKSDDQETSKSMEQDIIDPPAQTGEGAVNVNCEQESVSNNQQGQMSPILSEPQEAGDGVKDPTNNKVESSNMVSVGGAGGVAVITPSVMSETNGNHGDQNAYHAGVVTDADVIRLRAEEKKKLDVEGKLLLAPLTTVGNLPFRWVCKQLGADITCGEMAMCTNLLQGQTSEWALLKRHPSEDVFGVQLCGGFPDTMTKCAELLSEKIEVDFIDVNVGCPIDLVYHKGAGTGLMNRMGKFQEIVRGMSSVLDIPLTVKMRTGVREGSLLAHKIIPRVYDWGASVVTVHGRTREQRYTKNADWSYLKECADAASPHPFIGNGDILSFEDANFFQELSGVSGHMIARGALIKPWIFTEIKEQRHWDISSRERLDILQDYVNLGLMHWGSDSQGVQKTRRFLLEWQSFLHRYIPVGLLERLPQKINERPPYFVGRDDLETLMASANCADWIKLSEMFLGPIPDDFVFLPKHKANSYK